MLERLNRVLEKIMPVITPTGVIIGVLLGSHISGFAYLMPWVFAFMTFAGSISSNFRDFFQVIRQPLPLLFCMLILHVVMPLIGMNFGHLFFPGDAYTMTGLILAMAIPTGVSSFVWVSIYKGSGVLTLAIILLDTMLSPFVVPLTLSLLVGAKIHMEVGPMMESLFLMIVLPSVLGMFLNEWTKGEIKKTWGPRLSPFSKIAMGIVVALNGSVVSPYLKEFSPKLVEIALVVMVLASVGYVIGGVVAKLMHWDEDVVVAMMFNGGMRNISTGAILAVSYFPPPVAVPVVLAMLFQQSLAALSGHLLNHYFAWQKSRKQELE